MGIVDRPVEDEPEERPDQLGRALIRVKKEFPGQWREVYETSNRSTAVRIEGSLIGRGEGRIAGASDIEHWEARVVERTENGQTLHAVRVRWSEKPHGKDWRTKPKAALKKAEDPESVAEREQAALRAAAASTEGLAPETARVSGARGPRVPPEATEVPIPRDPEEAAQAGLDLAAG